MKKLFISAIIYVLLTNSCRSQKEVYPEGEWHRNCISFKENLDGYQMGGLPCQTMDIPKFRLQKGKSFETLAIYHSFDGTQTSNDSIILTGDLSKDGQILEIKYTLNSNIISQTFEAGPITEICTMIGCN